MQDMDAPLIPRSVIFGNPLRYNPLISPCGKMIAYAAPHNGVLNVWVKTVGKDDDRPLTSEKERSIMRFFWSADGKRILFRQDEKGDENWHLFGVELTSGTLTDYTPFSKVQARIIKVHKDFPDYILIALNKEDPARHDIYLLDLQTGGLTLSTRSPENCPLIIADEKMRPRAAMQILPNGGSTLLVADEFEGAWQKRAEWDFEDSQISYPISFSTNGKWLYLYDVRGSDTSRVDKMDLSSGVCHKVAHDPDNDAKEVLLDLSTGELLAVAFERDMLEWKVVDPSMEKDFANLSRLDRGSFTITSRDSSDNTWLVSYLKDDAPVAYWTYDRRSGKGEFLFEHKPDLNNYKLAKTEPFKFKARDGLKIHGYLTCPPDKGCKGLPMVLSVHGGPWARDVWGFSSEVQWLVNRGYAVMQVNYRGSTGYGKGFINAGNREWGGKMQTDLVDAVEWAKAEGVCDPERIAIYGGSYGGYAALCGATFTPDLFKCAVDIFGPSNLLTQLKSIPPYWKPFLEAMHRRIGHPEADKNFLISRSPLFRVEDIKIPMLVVQGGNDPRVKPHESEQVVEAMKRKGIKHEYLFFDDEGHGFGKPANRVKFHQVAERFLAEHMGGRYEP